MEICLVTGAAGFIGSTLAERLLDEGYAVVGIDSFADYYARGDKERNLAALRGRAAFTFLEADLLALDLPALLAGRLREAPEPISLLFHTAGQPGVRSSWGTSFEVYTRNNVLATQKLLEACRGLPLRRFVYSSSSSIYGDAESLPTPEETIPRPISPYGVSKLAAEHLCYLYWRTASVPTVSLRYFTVYGPRQRPDMAFRRFIRAIMTGEEIVLFGDGEQTRDFTFVADAVEANLMAARVGPAGQVFNIGGGSRVAVNQVIGQLESMVGRPARVRRAEAQAGDVRHTAADTGKAQELLGWQPAVSLQEGLAAQVHWQQEILAQEIGVAN